LFAIVKQSLSNSTQAILEANLLDLQKFIIKVLDYRTKNQSINSDKNVNMIEDRCIEAIITFVPKLSENSFRPFFYKVTMTNDDGHNEVSFSFLYFTF
jgi:BP28CT (NUC211) domain